MEESWLHRLSTALAADDEAAIVHDVRLLLGEGARLATWVPARTGWRRAHGDPIELDGPVPVAPGSVDVHGARLVRIGDDPTTSRVLLLHAPALAPAAAAAAADLLGVALGRIVARDRAAAAAQRLVDNERIGELGSYDWHIQSDTNRWSDGLFRIYGEEPQSFHPSYERFISFIHPGDRERVKSIHAEALATGEPFEMEERIVLRDGTERLLWSNGEVVIGPDGVPTRFLGICRDVTEQRRAERATAEAAEQRQRLHDSDIRRLAALELNDAVVQGLTSALWAQDIGAGDVARDLLNQTLERARHMMDDLLLTQGGTIPEAGELRRQSAPDAHLGNGDGLPVLEPATAVRPRRVVLADDAEDVRLLLGIQLRRLGFDIVGEAANGEEAVTLVAAAEPDVILLDLSMPVMDGLEAATAIRAGGSRATIIVVSGYAAASMEAPALEAGADAYLEKGTDIGARISDVLARVAA